MSTISLTTTDTDLVAHEDAPLADWQLLGRQVRYEQRMFWRNRARAISSVALPLMFLVVFNAINGSHHIEELGGISYATWFVPGILAYGLMMATFTNLAVSAAVSRDNGILKRVRGTGCPPWVFLAGKVISTFLTAVVLVTATLALGIGVYGVSIPWANLGGFALAVAAGTVCFTVLGLAVTTVIPNADAAPAILNLILLPLTFISGIWMVLADAPRWLTLVAEAFPVRALAHSLQQAVLPTTQAPAVIAADLLTLALWTVAGAVIALRWFRWEKR